MSQSLQVQVYLQHGLLQCVKPIVGRLVSSKLLYMCMCVVVTFPFIGGQPALLGRHVGGGRHRAEDVSEQAGGAAARRRGGFWPSQLDNLFI